MSKQLNRTDPKLLVLVSTQLTGEEGAPVGFAFRTKAEQSDDSGWNFWSGDENEDFLKDSENFVRYPLQHFLKLDDSLQEIINSEIGSSWERDPETDNWIKIEG